MMTIENFGNVVLSKHNEKTYQNLYASQAYGTFFGINGKFKLKKQSDCLDKLELYLVNYKGLLNMEIKNAELKLEQYKDGGKTYHYLDLHIEVKAALRSSGKIKKPVHLSSSVKNAHLKGYEFLLTRRTLLSCSGMSYDELKKSIQDPSSVDEKHCIVQGVFDDEFFYRNGNKRALRDVGDFSLIKPAAAGQIVDDTLICKQRFSKIYIP